METRHRTSTIFCLYFSISLLYFSIVSAFSPTDHYLIDCGSTQPTTTVDANRRFTGDSSELGSQFLKSTRTISLCDSNPSSSGLSPLYHTARVFTRPSKYAFKIRDRGTHLVRLHFHPFESSNFNTYETRFHVLANGYLLLNNFTVGKSQTSMIKDYVIWVDNEELVITFVPSKKSEIAFVNAIEVISAPKDLVADVAMLVNTEKIEKNGLMKNALETVYRVNVGGRKVTPFNDSLWRTWVPDDEFLKLTDGSRKVFFSGRIKYQIGGASREVGPDNVYNSARVISSSNNLVPQGNISWEFPVVGGYKYLVRLHFCDIASISLDLLYFNVYLNGNLAYENLDLSSITNMVLASPFYADFMVNMESSGVLTVSVGPSKMSMSNAIDGILNGVEIMKMNNSMGGLDGEVCADSVFKNWPSRNVGGVVPLIAAMCLLGTALVVMHRRWVGAKKSAGWSPIPVDVSEVNLNCGNQPSLGKA